MTGGPDASEERDELVQALMAVTRAMVGVAARSVAAVDADVTLPQFRAMVVLATRGPLRVADVAAELQVSPSTGTRMCERLVRKNFIYRERAGGDRRTVWVSLTSHGETVVERVTALRRAEIDRIVAALPGSAYLPAAGVLRALATAAGEQITATAP